MSKSDATYRRMAEERAMAKAGKKFIDLELLDYTKNRIQGAHILNVIRTRGENGVPNFHFEEIGGPLSFQLDEYSGTMTARVLDCEHNRKFLASMSAYNYWEILNKDIEKEILAQASGITRRAVRDMPEPDALSDEELEKKAAAMNAELERRKKAAEKTKEDGEEDPPEEPVAGDDPPPPPPKETKPKKKTGKKSMVAVED